MAQGKKRIIILDEKKADGSRVSPDETKELQRELDRYASPDDDDDDEALSGKVPAQRVHIKVRRHRKKNPGLRRRMLLLAVSVLILVLVIAAAVSGLSNDYRKPVSVYEEYLNKGGYSFEEAAKAYGNGLAGRRLDKLRKLMHSYDPYMEAFYASVDQSRAVYDENRRKYGDDFKYSIRINEAEPLSSAQCNAYTSDFAGIIEDIGGSGLAHMGDVKLNAALADLTASLDGARVTRGYRLYCTMSVSGSTAGGPVNEASSCEFTVVKLKGRWIMWDSIYDIFKLSYGLPAEP